MVIEVGFSENTLTKLKIKIIEAKVYPHPRFSSDNLIPLNKGEINREISGGTRCKISVVPFS